MSKLSQNLNLGQSQALVMTPQLQQAIKLLQLSNVELTEVVEEELATNPLLEKDERTSEDNDSENAPEKHGEQDEIDEAFEKSNTNDDFDPGSSMADIGAGGNSKFEDIENAFENRMSEDKTLRQHLIDQLHMTFEDNRDHMIGALLIDHLDESGYLREDPEELAEKLGCSIERINTLIRELKGFDPTGIFAHDLADCMALQLSERGQLDGPMTTLLDHLDMLANHDFKGLAEICGVNETYLKDMIEEIRSLNPKPAAEFDHLVVQTAIPDVIMKRLPKNLGGGWRVELNTETLPRVLVNNEYYAEVARSATQKKDKEYLTTQLQNANWLVRAMDQRAQTILKVAAEIIEQQDGFFNYGIEFLKPLKLSDIAAEIDMHESTVSRVTTNKYIGTPRGIFELKYFFSTALVSESGAAHSAEAVKARIKTLTDEEDPKKILSDDKIVAILKDEGIDLARRTVAKYREAMHIGSSVQRRKQKKHLAP
ncbi:MAG TPA: RNA polymerase factor sigma-54 [Alphaproteobacteria bacterium]|mgnify:CR=1 FL=1|nr:MAG: RNA polymerase factor sigma-54 [Rhodospirillales bacterium]HOO81410.1 RNA polymerase factor sigma-54 [Alphaproteobacteria bacterium]